MKIVAGTVGGAAGLYVLYEAAPWMNGKGASNKARQPLNVGVSGAAETLELIRYATLAASGHNAQPWKFRVSGKFIQIEPDPARRLPAVDPNDRELWISLGCALENLSLAARKVGYEPEISYPEVDGFIRVKLTVRKSEDNLLFQSIPERQNTRSEYIGQKLSRTEVSQLMSIHTEPNIELHLFESQSDAEKILEYVSQGDHLQFEDKAFVNELIHWIRFDKREALSSMDGLYSLCMGTPQVPRWIGKQVVEHMSPKKQADTDAKLLRSSAGSIAISSATDSKSAWVRTGQVYQRLALQMTGMNIKSAFVNQPNEVPGIRTQFETALGFGGSKSQLLLRFGFADRMPSSYRRSVDDVIIWS